MVRKKIVAGNWKMHKDVQEAYQFTRKLVIKLFELKRIEIILFPPFTALFHIQELLKEGKIKLGAQNMHWDEEGAYTGEISAKMLISCGCEYVILGHSERRHLFGEDNVVIRKKIDMALSKGLRPVVCVGETLEQREAGETEKILKKQFLTAFENQPIELFRRSIIAYEPVWAIGTGINATPDQAEDAHRFLRRLTADLFGREESEKIRILYGGSVKPENAGDLISCGEIDGFLIGGASLKEEQFTAIAEIVEKASK